MSIPIWSGSVGFGLVNIPVVLLSGLRPRAEQLHEHHVTDGAQIERRLFCASENEMIGREEVARAFQLDGRMIPIEDEEVESVAPYRSKTIDIERFVPEGDVDRQILDRPYLLAPADESEGALRSYRLLASVLRSERRIGIGRFVMRSREQLVMVHCRGEHLALHTLHFPDAARDHDKVDSAPEVGVGDTALEKARTLVRELAIDWTPEQIEDEQAQRLRRLAREKLAKGELIAPERSETEEREAVPDLMSALQTSLNEVFGKPGSSRNRRQRGGGGRKADRGETKAKRSEMSKEELYELAKLMKVPGRSKMNKEQLAKAVSE